MVEYTPFTWGGDAPATYGGDEPATWGDVQPVPPLNVDAPASLSLSATGHAVTPSGTAPAIQPDLAALDLADLTPGVAFSLSPEHASLTVDSISPTFAAGDWIIGSKITTIRPDVEISATELSLTVDVGEAEIDHWRQYDRSGDIVVDVGYGGEFEAIPRGGVEQIIVNAPIADQPPLLRDEWLVDSYNEDELGGGQYAVELDLQRTTPRESEYAAPDQSGEWTLETAHGTIGLEGWQVAPVSREGGSSGGEAELSLQLTDTQVIGIADAAVVPDAVADRAVPGGEDYAIDTSGGRQTVDIDAPASAALPDGTYVIREWSLTRAGGGDVRWLLELTVAVSA